MNSYIKMLVIVAIVATVGTVSAMTTIVQNAKAANVGSTYCDGKYSAGDSTDGCVSGQADCKCGKKYDTGKGHSGEFVGMKVVNYLHLRHKYISLPFFV